jgi:UDPglucose 6-dehydrogenase
MEVSIIGLGFVGLSLTSVLSSKGMNVNGIDIDIKKCETIKKGISPFFEPGLEKELKKGLKKKLKINHDISLIKNSDVIFVTVGTPQRANGSIELTMIKNSIKEIAKILVNEKISKKKAGKDFGIISNPEFLQESTAIKDTKYPHVVVLGGKKNKFMNTAKRIFEGIHPKTPIIITNHQTAEIIKYANNSFLATKISFINQLSNICQNIPGANIDDVAKTIGLDPRIGKLFLNAGPGYGGSCLPKDMKALINYADEIGINPTFLNAVEKINVKQLKNIISLIEKSLVKTKNKKITILGTAFKPNTDDIRDSISIELIKKLVKKEMSITVYDPKATQNTKNIFGTKINYAKNIKESLEQSQCLVIMVGWKEFEKLNNKLIDKMNKKFIIDCRRILVNKKLKADYNAIGIGK